MDTPVATRWIAADVTLLPRDDGRRQSPPAIFMGYRNSNLRFAHSGDIGRDREPDFRTFPFMDAEAGSYELQVGGAQFFPLDHDELQVGETGAVHMMIYGAEDDLNAELHVGARFMLYEAGRRVIRGTITALLHDPAQYT